MRLIPITSSKLPIAVFLFCQLLFFKMALSDAEVKLRTDNNFPIYFKIKWYLADCAFEGTNNNFDRRFDLTGWSQFCHNCGFWYLMRAF